MKTNVYIAIFLLLLSLAAVYVFAAVPEGPTQITVAASSRRTATPKTNISAIAGNVTQLTIQGTSTSQFWQGYYGNVSGLLSLETSAGRRLYAWTVANPQGEIYATEGAASVPRWGQTSQQGNISCWNYTKGQSSTDGPFIYYGEYEGWDDLTGAESAAGETWPFTAMGVRQNSVDSLNNTFQRNTNRPFPSFYVGNQYINGTDNFHLCPSLALYNSTNQSQYGGGEPTSTGGAAAGGNYQEVLLYDSSNFYIIYTAIIDYERSKAGFDGNVWDFEMIVAEKGIGSHNATTTEYNFYVELE